MAPLIILLRLLHILSGIVWFGGTFIFVGFVLPTAKRVGPDAGRFMQSLAAESRLPVVFAIAGWTTIIAGTFLFVFVSGGLDHDWLRSRMGATLTIGAVLGIAAALHGTFGQNTKARRLAVLSREIGATGGRPSPAQIAQLNALRDGLMRGGVTGTTLMTLSAAAMAIARYV